MKDCLTKHLEIMKHEMSREKLDLTLEGYKVDGKNGIKITIGMNCRKSVDYFVLSGDSCLFVEFSDIAYGEEDLLGLEDSVKEHASRPHLKAIQKLLSSKLRDELTAKFKDSKDIFSEITSFYNSPPSSFENTSAKIFYIVYAPINPKLSDGEKGKIARVLSNLKTQVSGSLESKICSQVKLVLLENFEDSTGLV
jgi:hypothetical protein